MTKENIYKYCSFVVIPNKGITMREVSQLSDLPKFEMTNTRLNETEIVQSIKVRIETELDRTNITAKDMRNAIVGLISW